MGADRAVDFPNPRYWIDHRYRSQTSKIAKRQLEIDLAVPAGPYNKGRQKVALPPYERYVGDIAELARAIRGETKMSTSLDDELAVQEVLITASQMVR